MPSHDPDLRRRLRARLMALSPRAFELFAGELLLYMGLSEVSVTRYSGDGGLDAVGSLEANAGLIRIPTGVQVKRRSANVGRPDIDRFIGALANRYAQGIFITTSGYAREAARKAAGAIPHIAAIDGAAVVGLMLRHRLGVAGGPAATGLDEPYFAQFEGQAARPGQLGERRGEYRAGEGRAASAEEDIISLRALSHALRVDPSVLRRALEAGRLLPDQPAAPGRPGHFFRRGRIPTIRAALLGPGSPAGPQSGEEWRQEFLDFARSRNLSKSYKPVLLKALLQLVDRDGAARLDELAGDFRAFYQKRRRDGLTVELGPPDISDPAAVSDAQLRQLIVKNPLERFLIKGFLSYEPAEGLVRFAPALWAELRAWELLELRRSADEQLDHYYRRGG